MKQTKRSSAALLLLLALLILLTGCGVEFSQSDKTETQTTTQSEASTQTLSHADKNTTLDDIPAYSGKPSVAINGNRPQFKKSEITTDSFETYGKPDRLSRCTTCTACVGLDIMPTVERGQIGAVKPTGWHTVRYEGIDGQYLYNRCHLIGYQLTGENANYRNLITGTRYLNTEGMLPYENEVASYVKKTHNHVMYRVTPVFKGEELVARGVQMQAYSVEDKGKGVSFNVYCYNVQPYVEIDYRTGDSRSTAATVTGGRQQTYILNTNSKKFHKPSCGSVQDISENHKHVFNGKRDELIQRGYKPCGRCNP